ncbi:HlyD family efflux transporter periplasmic adaptor subunit [Pseudonocardiaceae bacterium YIM PH 21723]|nr:HlyD family efflux transporter periplasmic adaptor subunit [Pseudonocardiaceae bacterium YIM PH 21723]
MCRMKTPRRRWVLALNITLVLLLGLLAYGGYTLLYGGTSAASGTTRTVTATKATVTQTVSAAGTVQSASSTPVAFGGVISTINVKVGDQVTQGQVLATTATTVLYAPTEGTVVSIAGAVGSATNGEFLVIQDWSAFQVRTNLSEIDVSKVKVGQTAKVTINAFADHPVDATVASVDLVPVSGGGNNSAVQYGATLTLGSVPDGAKPGQSASVAITVNKVDDAVSVPAYVVQGTGADRYVNVLVNGQQQRVDVTEGIKGDALTQITEGLNVGDQVVPPAVTVSTGTGTQRGNTGGGFPGGGGGGFQGGGQRGGGR